MNQIEFLNKLAEFLKSNGVERIDDILADYKEHFAMGAENGKTEAEISQKLGDPATIAKAYQTEGMIREIKNPETKFSFSKALNILGRLIILAPFNFLVIFIPGITLGSLLIAGWSIAFALFVVGPTILGVTIVSGIVGISFWVAVASIAQFLTLLGASVLITCLMFFLSKQFVLACISYLQWNLKFILQK